jgi:hypothetical protein
MLQANLVVSLCFTFFWSALSDCEMQNNCNGHGQCNLATSKCNCYEGWGAETDVTLYRAADCSARTCPSHRAWADVPTSPTTAHAVAECSNKGTCDRTSGNCNCFPGFTGTACERTICPNSCSGHGVCTSMKQMARMDTALPLGPNTYYEGFEDTTTWDEDMSYGCVCDSSWDVGLDDGQTQQPEWFGPDCSQRHCPSGDDPFTEVVETNCTGIAAPTAASTAVGLQGNLCHVDCSNRGICDHRTGVCQCFDGMYGAACNTIDATATYTYWNKGRGGYKARNHEQYQVI